jgi:hypothetical protein
MEIDITKWNQISEDAFKKMHYDSGVLVRNFNPATFDPETVDRLCTTSGNITVNAGVTMVDLGEDVNGIHGQYAELQMITQRTYSLGFTSLDLDLAGLKIALAAADIEGNMVKPRGYLKSSDFIKNIALIMFRLDGSITAAVLDYGLSTGGVSLTTSKEGKVTNAFTLTGFQTLANQSEPPMRFYAFENSSVTLDKHEAEMIVGGSTLTLTADAPEGVEITWSSDNTSEATVSDGIVTAVAAGTVTITASYTDEDEETHSDSCVIHIKAASV